MPRAVFNLQEPTDWRAVQGQWRVAPGLSSGEPHEGLVSQAVGSPARLPDDTDAQWNVCHDLTAGPSHGLTFAWDRLTATLPDTVHGRDIRRARLVFEVCLDDAGEIWIHGTCDRFWAHRRRFCRPCCCGDEVNRVHPAREGDEGASG